MEHYKETNTTVEEMYIHENSRVIDYAGMMNIVQLSIARQLTIAGANDTEVFTDVLARLPAHEREKIIREVGERYDEALVSFVTGSLIARRQRDIVILAEASEGIDGYFPWESKLQQRLQKCQSRGNLRDARVRVERFNAVNDTELATVLDVPAENISLKH